MKFVLILFLCFSAGLVHAQSRITVPLDASFLRTTFGEGTTRGADTFFPVVGFHKVVRHNGRVYVCVAVANYLLSGLNGHAIASRTRIVTAQGIPIRNGVNGWTSLVDTPRIQEKMRLASQQRLGPLYRSVFPSNIRHYAGTPVSCIVTRRTPTPAFFTDDTQLLIPQSVRIAQ